MDFLVVYMSMCACVSGILMKAACEKFRSSIIYDIIQRSFTLIETSHFKKNASSIWVK